MFALNLYMFCMFVSYDSFKCCLSQNVQVRVSGKEKLCNALRAVNLLLKILQKPATSKHISQLNPFSSSHELITRSILSKANTISQVITSKHGKGRLNS